MSSARDFMLETQPDDITNVMRALGAASYWPMQEYSGNLTDVIGGITGTANGTLTYGQAGWNGRRAILFDGSTGYFDCGDNFDFPSSDPYTAVGMLYTDSSAAASRWVCKQTSGTQGIAGQLQTNGSLICVRGSSAGSADNLTSSVTTQAVFKKGRWHLVGIGYDGSNTFVSLDGRIITTGTPTGTNAGSATTFKIGRQANTGSNYWNGRMHDVAIFTRGLKSSELAYLAQVHGVA